MSPLLLDQSVENNDRRSLNIGQVFQKIKEQSVSFDRITLFSKTSGYFSVSTESGQSNQCYTNMQFL